MFNVSLFMVNTWTCIFFQTKREGLKGEEIQKHGKGRNNKKSKPQVLLFKWISVGIIFTISQLHWAWAWELPCALFPSTSSQTTASHMWWWHTPAIPVLRGLNRSLSDNKALSVGMQAGGRAFLACTWVLSQHSKNQFIVCYQCYALTTLAPTWFWISIPISIRAVHSILVMWKETSHPGQG